MKKANIKLMILIYIKENLKENIIGKEDELYSLLIAIS